MNSFVVVAAIASQLAAVLYIYNLHSNEDDNIMLCDKCKKNEVQIYNDCCDCCISCWYDMTDPKV